MDNKFSKCVNYNTKRLITKICFKHNMDLYEALLLAANIPLIKFLNSKFREFLEKYIHSL